MSVSEIDILQTEQIEALQVDVQELRDKLNLIVTDITHATNGLTKKLNDAIEDADDLNNVLNAGYSTASGAGSASHGILEMLDQLYEQLEDHAYTATSHNVSAPGLATHPPDSSLGTSIPAHSPGTSNLSGTAQGNGNARSLHTSVAQAATSTPPEYISDKQSVMTLKNRSERRARKIARTLLKRTR